MDEATPDTQGAFAGADQTTRYEIAARRFGPALARLARAYEANPAHCEELVQDIHLQLWRSLRLFDGRCSLRTWVYRVAHNVAAGHVAAQARRRDRERPGAERLETADPGEDPESAAGRALALERLHGLIRALPVPDKQIALLHLEDVAHNEIAEITGLSSAAVATRLNRIKARLKRAVEKGEPQ